MCVALAVLEAIVEMEGPDGRRRLPFHLFHRAPGDTPDIETALDHGELVTAVELPKPAPRCRSRYFKVRDRASYEFALVSVAALLEISAGRIGMARIAFGGVGTVPWRAWNVEQVLTGAEVSASLLRDAADKAMEGAAPRRHNGFKVELLRRTVLSALQEITGAGQ